MVDHTEDRLRRLLIPGVPGHQNGGRLFDVELIWEIHGVPGGIRTRVTAVKGRLKALCKVCKS
jgi:hypothetical protein